MDKRYRISKAGVMSRLRLSARRKSNKGKNLAIWRKKQKELAALGQSTSQAGASRDVEQDEVSDDPVHRSSQDTSATNVDSTAPIENNSSQIVSNVLQAILHQIDPAFVSNVEHSSTAPAISSSDPSTIPSAKSSSSNTTLIIEGPRTAKFIAAQKISDAAQKIPGISGLENIAPKKPKPVACGRRIIDVGYFLKSLKVLNNHSKSGQCNLNNMIIIGEEKVGILSSYKLRCTECEFEKVIRSECQYRKKNLNTQFNEAVLSVKCSLKAINNLFHKMELPSLTPSEYKEECAKVRKKKKGGVKTHRDSKKNSKKLEKNTKRERLSNAVQESTSYQNVNVGVDCLIVEDQLEIKNEGNYFEDEDESEIVTPDLLVMSTYGKTLVGQEQETLSSTILKQEINSDVDDEDLTGSTTSVMERLEKESHIEYGDRLKNQKSLLKNPLPTSKKATTIEGTISCTMFVNQEQGKMAANQNDIKLNEKQAKQKLYSGASGEKLTKPTFSSMGTTMNKKSAVPCYKAKTGRTTDHKQMVTCVTNQKNHANPQNFPTAFVNTGRTFFTSSEINKPLNSTQSTSKLDGVSVALPSQYVPINNETSGFIVPQLNEPSNATPSTSNLGRNTVSVPLQYTGGLIAPQIPYITYQSPATFIPIVSNVFPQQSGESGSGVLPFWTQPPQSVSSYSTSINNPQVIIPGVSSARPVLGAPTVVQQPANSSNNVPVPTTVDNSRWIGRGNMNSNNSSCKLPGGAPKGVSDPVPPKKHIDQSSSQSKQIGFHCDDCDISFEKYESLDSHKKSYCIKRLKFAPSSTVTSHMLMSNSLQSSHLNHMDRVTPSVKSHIEQLVSSMAIKRSLLEASMKTALDAQYVINVHKSAQDLTQKSFKELDDALKREKALTSEASLNEQQIVSEARTQALVRAEAAYMQEKHSAAAVEHALCRQKSAIEATLAATGHEQSALVSTLHDLKVQANQNSMFQTQYQNHEVSFNQEKPMGTSLPQTAKPQQVAGNIFTRSVPVQKTSSASSNYITKQRNEIGAISHNAQHNSLYCDIYSEKSAVNSGKNKSEADVMKRLSKDSLQHKKINTSVSCGNSDTSMQTNKKTCPDDYFQFQKAFSLNLTTSSDTSLISTSEYQMKNWSCHSTQPLEPRDLNSKSLFENSNDIAHRVDMCLTPSFQSQEMMDIDIASSSKSTQVLTSEN